MNACSQYLSRSAWQHQLGAGICGELNSQLYVGSDSTPLDANLAASRQTTAGDAA